MSDVTANIEETIKKAEERGFKVYRSDSSHLLVDLDDGVMLNDEALTVIEEHFGLKKHESWKSKSDEGEHHYIELDSKLPLEHRIALQAALNSDGKREVLHLVEMRDYGIMEPCLLFRPADTPDLTDSDDDLPF